MPSGVAQSRPARRRRDRSGPLPGSVCEVGKGHQAAARARASRRIGASPARRHSIREGCIGRRGLGRIPDGSSRRPAVQRRFRSRAQGLGVPRISGRKNCRSEGFRRARLRARSPGTRSRRARRARPSAPRRRRSRQPGSATRWRFDSSRRRCWMLRASARAWPSETPSASVKGCTRTLSAPPIPAEKAAIVVRRRLVCGSARVIMRRLVSACSGRCEGAAPQSSSRRAKHSRSGAELGDREELVAVDGDGGAEGGEHRRRVHAVRVKRAQPPRGGGQNRGDFLRLAAAGLVHAARVERGEPAAVAGAVKVEERRRRAHPTCARDRHRAGPPPRRDRGQSSRPSAPARSRAWRSRRGASSASSGACGCGSRRR